jgi:hypothetical protein
VAHDGTFLPGKEEEEKEARQGREIEKGKKVAKGTRVVARHVPV